jgi:predicted nuclease of predicted toxin-antitoxin system
MKLRFLADANFVSHIRTGLVRREPSIDFQTADSAELTGKSDAEVLQIAASDNRILVTHDRKTIPTAFAKFIQFQPSPGVLIVPLKLVWVIAIEELLLIWSASEADEWVNTISPIPL